MNEFCIEIGVSAFGVAWSLLFVVLNLFAGFSPWLFVWLVLLAGNLVMLALGARRWRVLQREGNA